MILGSSFPPARERPRTLVLSSENAVEPLRQRLFRCCRLENNGKAGLSRSAPAPGSRFFVFFLCNLCFNTKITNLNHEDHEGHEGCGELLTDSRERQASVERAEAVHRDWQLQLRRSAPAAGSCCLFVVFVFFCAIVCFNTKFTDLNHEDHEEHEGCTWTA